MFSQRFSEAHDKNLLTRRLERKRAEGTSILDLTESNPTRAHFDYPAEEILSALADPRSLLYQPDPNGLEEARRGVARYYAERGHPIPIQDILLTCSTSEAYSFLFKLLLNPGEKVLVPRPSYPLIDFLAVAESVQTVPYPLVDAGGWQIDLEGLEGRVQQEARAVVVVHPNNPTGSLVKRGEMETIRRLCRNHRLALICDEVFFDYRLDTKADPVDFLDEEEVLTFVLNGLSKLVGLPQMKLSWMILRGPDPLKRRARERLEVFADTFLSVASPVQYAASRLLETRHCIQEQIRRRLDTNLGFLRRSLEGSAADLLPLEGGWYAVVRVPRIHSGKEWALRLLQRQDVLVHPGDLFGFSPGAFLVISLLPHPKSLAEGISRLAREIEESWRDGSEPGI